MYFSKSGIDFRSSSMFGNPDSGGGALYVTLSPVGIAVPGNVTAFVTATVSVGMFTVVSVGFRVVTGGRVVATTVGVVVGGSV
jgi:hypothetical protein